VFTSTLHRNGSSYIVACVFISAATCLPSPCLAMHIHCGTSILALKRHVILYIFSGILTIHFSFSAGTIVNRQTCGFCLLTDLPVHENCFPVRTGLKTLIVTLSQHSTSNHIFLLHFTFLYAKFFSQTDEYDAIGKCTRIVTIEGEL
jgi:hypothetical protein